MTNTAQASLALINAQAQELEDLRSELRTAMVHSAMMQNTIDALNDDIKRNKPAIDTFNKIAMIRGLRIYCRDNAINENGFNGISLNTAKHMMERMIEEVHAYDARDTVYNSPY